MTERISIYSRKFDAPSLEVDKEEGDIWVDSSDYEFVANIIGDVILLQSGHLIVDSDGDAWLSNSNNELVLVNGWLTP